MEFSDGMQAVSFALNTGYSIENAFAEAVGELELLYGKESSIVREFRMMVNRIKRNEAGAQKGRLYTTSNKT